MSAPYQGRWKPLDAETTFENYEPFGKEQMVVVSSQEMA
jgi:hypothetical protein